jgi:YidC/Oxa1 family membrane protein insertase
VLMGWFAYSFASGLALYFVVSNLVSIAQYAILGKLDFSKLLPAKAKVTQKSSRGPK